MPQSITLNGKGSQLHTDGVGYRYAFYLRILLILTLLRRALETSRPLFDVITVESVLGSVHINGSLSGLLRKSELVQGLFGGLGHISGMQEYKGYQLIKLVFSRKELN